ncbi:tRNA (adenosine(37)-N6)-threonylcarbamoyltransferase complex transferase subunit TsaD [Alphaproteobacteria bacterium]|nr:tRNA (adenosine(37)-N6)-threonylcarbamoyltransferase complex transferase subunit TsaD [Alphaproteobacteria bacterium]
MIVLGIETSCDETAAAVVSSEREILSESIYSQIKTHEKYLGVVPELAARSHIDHCSAVVKDAINKANLSISQVDVIAATAGPGLLGGLLVGLTTAKAISLASKKPFIAINHLDGHALTPRLSHSLEFPYLLLLISGGHSMFLAVEGPGKYKLLGQSIDDALGEAFDKTGRLLGLGYPGGPAIEKIAVNGDPFRFKLPHPLKGRDNCDFSFSGLKTAVRQTAEKLSPLTLKDREDIAASFQYTICKIIEERLKNAIREYIEYYPNDRRLAASGGVASNNMIRKTLLNLAEKNSFDLFIPEPKLCTDNGAMIAWAGVEHSLLGHKSDYSFDVRARWPLGENCYEF